MWVNVESFNDKDRLLEKITSNAGYSIQLRNEGQIALQMDGTSNDYYVESSLSIPANTWILVTAIIAFNGRSTTPSKVYVNNTEFISLENTESSTGSNNNPLKINSGQTPGSREPISKIGAVYVYNKALSTAEIAENINATKGRFGIA
jgi:hypothetical protein